MIFREELIDIADNIHEQGILLSGGIGLLLKPFAKDGRLERSPLLSFEKKRLEIEKREIKNDKNNPLPEEITQEHSTRRKVSHFPGFGFTRIFKQYFREEQQNICAICGQSVPPQELLNIHHRVPQLFGKEDFLSGNVEEKAQLREFLHSRANALGVCRPCHNLADRIAIKEHGICEVDIEALPKVFTIKLHVISCEEINNRRNAKD